MAGKTVVQVKLWLDESDIQFLKEEAARRNLPDSQIDWTWRELAWVKASILMQDWIVDQRAKLKERQALEAKVAAAKPDLEPVCQ